MPRAEEARKRRAVYTRKSSEEGLEQEFNSLAAQCEACEAFIRSPRQEGWVSARTRYDDGGFSGGNIERPGLQRLLADVAAGRIDIVVVYKVDRLTRSLADFARLVEIFDAQGVSIRVGNPAIQYDELDGAADAQRAAVLCPVRAGGDRRTHSRQDRRFEEEGPVDGGQCAARL
jgi:DNA invertase Pin-like site-specific DNA recombinase